MRTTSSILLSNVVWPIAVGLLTSGLLGCSKQVEDPEAAKLARDGDYSAQILGYGYKRGDKSFQFDANGKPMNPTLVDADKDWTVPLANKDSLQFGKHQVGVVHYYVRVPGSASKDHIQLIFDWKAAKPTKASMTSTQRAELMPERTTFGGNQVSPEVFAVGLPIYKRPSPRTGLSVQCFWAYGTPKREVNVKIEPGGAVALDTSSPNPSEDALANDIHATPINGDLLDQSAPPYGKPLVRFKAVFGAYYTAHALTGPPLDLTITPLVLLDPNSPVDYVLEMSGEPAAGTTIAIESQPSKGLQISYPTALPIP